MGSHEFIIGMLLNMCGKPTQSCSIIRTAPFTYHLNICGETIPIDNMGDWIGYKAIHYHTKDQKHYHTLYVSNRNCTET